MTDKQLHILLDTLRQELAKTIEESEQLLSVHGVERRPKMVARTEDGKIALGLGAFGATMAGRLAFEDDPFGRFVALAPLDVLVRDWELRFIDLLPEKEEAD